MTLPVFLPEVVMEKTFNFTKLAEANKLAHKWMERLGIKKTLVFKFVKSITVQDPKIMDTLSEEEKIELLKDAEIIRYTMDIENDMIEQNIHYIKYVAKKCKVRQFTDEHLSYGLQGMRKSIYYYTNDAVKFSTFCFNGVKRAFAHLYYFTKPKKTKGNNAILATDLHAESSKNNLENIAVYTCDFDEDNADEMAIAVPSSDAVINLCKEAGLKDIQIKLLQAYMNKTNVLNWLENFMSTHGLTCSKQAVYVRLKRTIQKLKAVYDSKHHKNS